MTSMTVLVADDHVLVRESVTRVVAAEPGFEVIAEASSGTDALDLIQSKEPDIVLLDITMPGLDGLQTAARIRQRFPNVRIIMLTMHEDDANIRAAMGISVDGYVSKGSGLEELVDALRSIAAGDSYLASGIARRVMHMAAGRSVNPAGTLTKREFEVLRLLAAGGRPADIASKLHLSIKTIKNHLTTVYAKLGVATASQAVAEAYRLGIVSASSPN
jgi:DNA-binding NarL/FixJ family response regulator